MGGKIKGRIAFLKDKELFQTLKAHPCDLIIHLRATTTCTRPKVRSFLRTSLNPAVVSI